MSSILAKLNEELDRIRLEQKREAGLILSTEEIKNVFDTLKKEDFELKPVLEAIETLISVIPDEKYMLKEETLVKLLKYYNLIDNNDIMSIRHKLFFTEERKMVKKPYFSPESSTKIKEKIQDIFAKL